jgi:hypothetical protein
MTAEALTWRSSMCSGIEYEGQMHLWKDTNVHLPVRLRDGAIKWIRWGERHGIESPFFQGPCARLESIHEGKWSRFSPVAVKIVMDRYMERDLKNKPYWVKAPEGAVLQGLLATWGDAQRVYVVTTDTPTEFQHVQPRWPRVIQFIN